MPREQVTRSTVGTIFYEPRTVTLPSGKKLVFPGFKSVITPLVKSVAEDLRKQGRPVTHNTVRDAIHHLFGHNAWRPTLQTWLKDAGVKLSTSVPRKPKPKARRRKEPKVAEVPAV